MPLAPPATLATEPGLESGTSGLSGTSRCHVPQMHHTLLHISSGWGGDMNVAGGDIFFCLCFKESDVPFVNIQEKY